MAKKEKKHVRLDAVHRDRIRELEGRLFGATASERLEFGTEAEETATYLPRGAQQENTGDQGPLIVWEDRRPEGFELTASDAASESGSGSSASDGDDSDAEKEVSAVKIDPARNSDATQPGSRASQESAEAEASESSDGASQEGGDEDEALQERRESGAEAGPFVRRRPAWEDSDEEDLRIDIAGVSRLRKLRAAESEATLTGSEYVKRLKTQHVKLNPRTSWASLGRDTTALPGDSSDEDPEQAETLERVAQGAGKLLTGGSLLPAGLVEMTRLKDANQQEPSQAVVQSVGFHPSGQLLMTAGLDKRLRFFQVDGVKNAKVQSVYLSDLPIQQAAFCGSGSKVVASGRRKHFYVLDLEAGKVERVSQVLRDGNKGTIARFSVSPDPTRPLLAFLGGRGFVSLVSWQSRQPVATLKMPTTVSCAAFSDDGSQLMASGGDGIVQTWDLRTRQCVSRFVDQGNMRATALATSHSQRWLATGSDSGFVNIYNQQKATEAGGVDSGLPRKATMVAPLKSLDNLTTEVDNLAFSPDGQVLAMSSSLKKDALRLVHTATMTVFSNWPTQRSPLSSVHCTAFSPNGGFFAVGNARGKVLLYRMQHYPKI